MQKNVDDQPLSGVMVLLKNPKNGASIKAKNISNGQPLVLPRGGAVIVDRTVAKAAQYVWGFLEIDEKLPSVSQALGEEISTPPVPATNSSQIVDELTDEERESLVESDMPEPGQQSQFIDSLSYNDMKFAAGALGVKNTSQMTKVMLIATLTGFGEASVREALESKED